MNTQSSFYPPPEGVKLKYGTAGFREKAAILDSTFFRMGMLGILRSRQLEKTIGLMVVTASHNAAPDNGRPTAISSPVAPQRRRAGPQEVARDRQTVVTISDFLPVAISCPPLKYCPAHGAHFTLVFVVSLKHSLKLCIRARRKQRRPRGARARAARPAGCAGRAWRGGRPAVARPRLAC